MQQTWPCSRWYWGYIWDPASTRNTAPIRNQANKSFMPEEQYPFDFYPPFASGCGFVLSWDLVQALLAQPLPDYRLLDPPFGIHLTGKVWRPASLSCVRLFRAPRACKGTAQPPPSQTNGPWMPSMPLSSPDHT